MPIPSNLAKRSFSSELSVAIRYADLNFGA